MSVSLFNATLTGAIETLLDEQNQPLFKRADLGRYLNIARIKDMFKNVEYTARCDIKQGAVQSSPPKQHQNDHDAFVYLDAALEIVVRSKKPKAVELAKWLAHRGVATIEKEHQKVIEERDTRLALLNDDLTESQDLVRSKDQQIARLEQRYVDHCRDPRKDNVVIITRKHTSGKDDKHFEYPYYISRIQRYKIPTKRRWLLDQFPHSEEIVVIDSPNSVHAFNRFEEEGHVERYKCHFKLIDLTREDLYEMGVPAIDA